MSRARLSAPAPSADTGPAGVYSPVLAAVFALLAAAGAHLELDTNVVVAAASVCALLALMPLALHLSSSLLGANPDSPAVEHGAAEVPSPTRSKVADDVLRRRAGLQPGECLTLMGILPCAADEGDGMEALLRDAQAQLAPAADSSDAPRPPVIVRTDAARRCSIAAHALGGIDGCLLYTSPSPRDS